MVKNLPADAGDMRNGLFPIPGKIPWKRAWQPTRVFLCGESHGESRPWGHSQAQLSTHAHVQY